MNTTVPGGVMQAICSALGMPEGVPLIDGKDLVYAEAGSHEEFRCTCAVRLESPPSKVTVRQALWDYFASKGYIYNVQDAFGSGVLSLGKGNPLIPIVITYNVEPNCLRLTVNQ